MVRGRQPGWLVVQSSPFNLFFILTPPLFQYEVVFLLPSRGVYKSCMQSRQYRRYHYMSDSEMLRGPASSQSKASRSSAVGVDVGRPGCAVNGLI